MNRVILAAPLLPDKVEAWHRFCQEMTGRRRQQHERSRRRLDIIREAAWLVPTPNGQMVVIAIVATDVAEALHKLATSQRPFDCWFRRNILEIHGLDLSRPLAHQPGEPIFHWRCPD